MIEFGGAILFIFGTIIGSFLNVVVFRLHTGRGLSGRSMCFSCTRTLTWFDLIPIASFMAFRGRCRTCKVKLSYQYPLVEVLTGFVFASFGVKYLMLLGVTPAFLVAFVLVATVWSLLIAITAYDIKHMIIPQSLVWIFTLFAFLTLFIDPTVPTLFKLPQIKDILAGPLLALPFFALWFFSKGRALGYGDVKLALGLGFLAGFSGFIPLFFIAFWIGGFVSIILLLTRPKKFSRKTALPFAPFLVISTFFVTLFTISYTFLF